MNIHATGLIIFNSEGKMLVLRGQKDTPEGGLLGLPGGKVPGDGDSLNSVLRKTFEETSLKFNRIQITKLKTFVFTVANDTITFEVYLTKHENRLLKVLLNMDDHSSYNWEKPDELINRAGLMKGMYPILNYLLRKPSKVI